MTNFQDRAHNEANAPDLPQEIWTQLRHRSSRTSERMQFTDRELDAVSTASGLAASLAILSAGLMEGTEKELGFFGALFQEFLSENGRILRFACLDLLGAQRASASSTPLRPYLRSTVFHGLLCQRICHGLWLQDRVELAMLVHRSSARGSGVRIHPSVDLGYGIVVEEGGTVLVGEGVRVGNNVRFASGVVVRRSELEEGSQPPRISDGASLLGGARVLGPVTVGAGSTVAPHSVVLQDVPAYAVVRGNPAVAVGENRPDPGHAPD